MEKIFQRVNQYLLFAVLLVIVLYFGKTILIPLLFGALFAMLMAPLATRLDRKGLHRALSTLACVLLIFFSFLIIGGIIAGQIASFSKDMPKIEKKAKTFMDDAQGFIEEKLNLPLEKQKEIAKKQAESTVQKAGGVVTKVLGAITSIIAGLALTLVFTFLMIFNREHFEQFFIKLYRDEDTKKVQKVVREIATVSHKYLKGRAMSIMINATLYAIGLSLVGIQNAILLAGVAAIMTLVPYVGTVIGGLFPVLMALVTESSVEPALWAAAVLFFIQTVDNYFIEPNIVGGEVNLSALTTIVALIVGGLIWGAAGMILFLPMTGIVKIVCDHVESLQPIGHLLGEPGGKKPSRLKLWIQQKLGKKKRRNSPASGQKT